MGSRISTQEALSLYKVNDLNLLSKLATEIRERKNGKTLWYNKNFHLEPSNVCIHKCKFCSYRRDDDSQEGAWTMNFDDVARHCAEKYTKGVTEVHIVGSVHPTKDISYYLKLIETVREQLPSTVTIKAFSAIEIDDMCTNGGISAKKLLTQLKTKGVKLLPGGGAEIFNPEVRKVICPDKADASRWLDIHKTAHQTGIKTNATMLFGHIETREHRIEHLSMLRELQDDTGGFDAFIPLVFKPANNQLSHIAESDIIEILKTFAISRIFLDNFDHIKSYWPMLGKEKSQLTLLYGADDIDGTINNSTRIYSMAGSQEQSPDMTVKDIEKMASECGYRAKERDSFYNEVVKK